MVKIIAMKKNLLMLLVLLAGISARAFFANTPFTVTGTVTDNNNQPVAGATIAEKSTKNTTITDNNGHFSIVVSSNHATIEVMSAGYENNVIKINGANIQNIKLKPAATTLDEVVVMGYSAVKKKSISGSVSSISKSYYTPPPIYTDNKITAENFNREGYVGIDENNFKSVSSDPLSTFSIDVDGASYSNVRRIIESGQLPPQGAVRIEEMINYFHYDYPQPGADSPFSINTETTVCPWNKNHRLALIGLQGKKIPVENLPASNLVFLIDVSGSMDEPDKLPLVKSSLKLLVQQLRNIDRVSIVVYAGNAGLVLAPTNGNKKEIINNAINELEAGGSTAGGAGIQLAYKTAREYFNNEGNNRVILCTDGDFNIGLSSDDALERMIEKERESGIYLSVLGFGTGNYQDAKMQKLADKGNGNHNYIDNENEAKKVFVNEFGGTLFTIANDVKLQIEFNPAKVQAYRLIGYENRMLNKEDFNNDKKDAGELGSGHTVTALYEIIPAGIKDSFVQKTDPLKYQQTKENSTASGELMTVKFRYKKPGETASRLLVKIVNDKIIPFNLAGENLAFASCVAEFGMLLRQSEFKQNASYNHIIAGATKTTVHDKEGYRPAFFELVKKAASLAREAVDEDDVSRN
jgi:Ca-activated chloride channel family protein